MNNQPIPYMYSQNEEEFVCFDDSDSIIFKTNYAKEKGLGGISLFSLDFDDFTWKFCMSGKFPLLKTARETLNEFKQNKDDINLTDDYLSSIESTLDKFF